VVTRQIQVERKTRKVRPPETDILPLSYAANLQTMENGYEIVIHHTNSPSKIKIFISETENRLHKWKQCWKKIFSQICECG